MLKKVKVYTSTTCASCEMVKKWLKMKSLSYEEVNVEDDLTAMQDAIKLSGQSAVPVVVIDDPAGMQDVIIGFKPARLAESLL